jgi:hypothetical protein
MKARVRTKRKPAASRKPAARRAAGKASRPKRPLKAKAATRVKAAPDPLDAMIDAVAATLALPVDPAWRPAVRTHLQVTLGHAAFVEAFALADDAEPAPVFRA